MANIIQTFPAGSGGGGTSDYNDLTNKPQIAGTTLSGNTSLATLGLTSSVETQSSGGTTKSYVNTGEKYTWNTCGIVYGTCSTSASTTAKSVTISRGTFNFDAGSRIAVKFSYSNTASTPTLTVSSTTKNIKCIDETGSTYTPVIWWDAGDIVEFVYDGTQFLMQPTMGMMFKIQGTTMDREAIFSTAEKVVGCWTDGRPIYQKTISITTPTVSTDGTVVENVYSVGATVKQFISMVGYFTGSSNNAQMMFPRVPPNKNVGIWLLGCPDNYTTSAQKNSIKIQSAYTGFNNGSGHITVQYTKTTDSANSFNYADPNDYSTTEKVIGTWTDGKKLYQKVVTGTTDSSSAAKYISLGVSISTPVSVELMIADGLGNFLPVNGANITTSSLGSSTVNGIKSVIINNSAVNNKNTLGIATNVPNWQNANFFAIIKYTKT